MTTRGGRAVGIAAFGVAAAAGAALAWSAERRGLAEADMDRSPEWAGLQQPVDGRALPVRSLDGTVLHAEVSGPEHAPTLVFAHGYGMAQEIWHYQRRDLSEAFRVVSYDQRGHARSSAAETGDYSVEALGHDLAAVVEACVPPDCACVVVGHSMGGMGVLACAQERPELFGGAIRGTVLVDTSGSDVLAGVAVSAGIALLGGLQQRVARAALRLVNRRPRLVDRIYVAPTDLSFLMTRAVGLTADADPAHVAMVERLLLQCPTPVKAALGPTITGLDLRSAVAHVRVPALVVVGERDRLTPPAAARKLVADLPDATLVVLPRAGHNTPLEAHDELTELIAAFAQRVLTPTERRAV